MENNKNNEQRDEKHPKIVGNPVSAPVNIDQVLAYGKGHTVHWEREADEGNSEDGTARKQYPAMEPENSEDSYLP